MLVLAPVMISCLLFTPVGTVSTLDDTLWSPFHTIQDLLLAPLSKEAIQIPCLLRVTDIILAPVSQALTLL
jgi:hypothetical protein